MAENWWEEDPVEESTNWWEEDAAEGEDPAPTDDALLPAFDISRQMYTKEDGDNMAYDDAMDLFRQVLADPNTTVQGGMRFDELLQKSGLTEEQLIDSDIPIIYTDPNTGNREFVPRPDRTFFGFGDDAKVGIGQTIRLGIAESIGDAFEFGGAVSDKYFGTDGAQDAMKQITADLETRTIGGSLLADGVPALGAAFVPGTAIYKGTKGISTAVQNAPKVVQFLATAVRGTAAATGAEAAATATVGTEEGNFLFGEDTIFSGVAELGDTEADQLLEQRLNTFTEGLVAGGVLSTGLKIGSAGVKATNDLLIAPLVRVLQGDRGVERGVYERISVILSNVGPTATPNEQRAAVAEITEIIRENKDLIVADFEDLAETKKITLDTVGAMTRGMDPRTQGAAIDAAQGVRAGVANSAEGAVVRDAMNRPVTEVRAGIDAERAALAGDQTEKAVIGDSAQGFANIAKDEIDDAVGGFANARQEFESAAQEAVGDIQDDTGFIQAITRLENVTGTEIVEPKTAAFKDILRALESNYAQMYNTKNSLYAAVQGGDIDGDAVFDLFSRIPAEQISMASVTFKRGNTFLQALQPQRVSEEIDGKMVTRLEEPEETRERFLGWLQENNADFGFFYTGLRPEFAKLASDAFRNKDTMLGSMYREIVNFIDEDMLKHIEDADPELAEAATAAADYYKNTFARIWRDEDAMQQFSNIYDSTLGRTGSEDLSSAVTRTEPRRGTFDAKAEDLTKGILQGGNMGRTVNLARALPSTDDASRIADYFILDTVNGFANSVRTQGLDNADYSGFSRQLMQYAEQLNELAATSPELASKVQSINQFIARLERAGGNQAKVEEILAGAQQNSKALIEDVERSVLGKFFDAERTPSVAKLLQGANIPVTSDPEGAFRAIFTAKTGGKNEAPNRVSDLMTMIGQMPEAEQPILLNGLKLAYNRFLDDQTLALAEEAGKVRPVKVGPVEKGMQDMTQLFEIGDIIYAGQPQFMDAVRGTLQAAADAAQGARSTPIRSQSATAFNQETATATTRLIYLVVGPLTRAGSRIRAVMGAAVERADSDSKAKAILANILADPDYFLELADKYNRAPSDPLLEDLMYNYISSALIKVNTPDEDEDTMLNNMQDTLQNASETVIDVGSRVLPQ